MYHTLAAVNPPSDTRPPLPSSIGRPLFCRQPRRQMPHICRRQVPVSCSLSAARSAAKRPVSRPSPQRRFYLRIPPLYGVRWRPTSLAMSYLRSRWSAPLAGTAEGRPLPWLPGRRLLRCAVLLLRHVRRHEFPFPPIGSKIPACILFTDPFYLSLTSFSPPASGPASTGSRDPATRGWPPRPGGYTPPRLCGSPPAPARPRR